MWHAAKVWSPLENVLYVTVTVEGKWKPFFGFWTNQYISVPNRISVSWRFNKKFLRNQNFSLEMTKEDVAVHAFIP